MREIYLVGGAVRDSLLNLPVKDRDWLVVGSSPEQLLAEGFQQVGADFPVFLHPITREEYALARTERKNGKGYNGFICDFSPNVRLEDDLIRRDLTINAIAQKENGEIIDPYGGVIDLRQRILRHISPAFREDPLRVLRVARFAARFYHLGFRIAEETLNLMREMVDEGELTDLTAERVWLETQKAFETENPEIYFSVLRSVGGLRVLFPELDALFGIPQPEKHHPEIDSGEHTLLVLAQAKILSQQSSDPHSLLFAAICHDLGKAFSPKDNLPHHYGHERNGIKPTEILAERLKVAAHTKEFAILVTEFHSHCHRMAELRPETVVKLFNRLDVWRKPARFEDYLRVCEADSRGRKGFEERDYPQAELAKRYYQAAVSVDVQQVIADGFEQKGIRIELDKRRIAAVQKVKEEMF